MGFSRQEYWNGLPCLPPGDPLNQRMEPMAEQPLTGEYWIPPKKKKVPHTQGQRKSPGKTVGGAKLGLKSNPIPARDAWRTQTKPHALQDPETPQRLSQTSV